MGIFKDLFKGYDKTKTTKKLSYDELYEVIKDGNFPCGKPELTGSGIMRCIKFPPVDKYVIQIAVTGQTITVSKVYSGVAGIVKENVVDAVSGGLYSTFNGESIDLNKMTEVVTTEIKRLLDENNLLLKK